MKKKDINYKNLLLKYINYNIYLNSKNKYSINLLF